MRQERAAEAATPSGADGENASPSRSRSADANPDLTPRGRARDQGGDVGAKMQRLDLPTVLAGAQRRPARRPRASATDSSRRRGIGERAAPDARHARRATGGLRPPCAAVNRRRAKPPRGVREAVGRSFTPLRDLSRTPTRFRRRASAVVAPDSPRGRPHRRRPRAALAGTAQLSSRSIVRAAAPRARRAARRTTARRARARRAGGAAEPRARKSGVAVAAGRAHALARATRASCWRGATTPTPASCWRCPPPRAPRPRGHSRPRCLERVTQVAAGGARSPRSASRAPLAWGGAAGDGMTPRRRRRRRERRGGGADRLLRAAGGGAVAHIAAGDDHAIALVGANHAGACGAPAPTRAPARSSSSADAATTAAAATVVARAPPSRRSSRLSAPVRMGRRRATPSSAPTRGRRRRAPRRASAEGAAARRAPRRRTSAAPRAQRLGCRRPGARGARCSLSQAAAAAVGAAAAHGGGRGVAAVRLSMVSCGVTHCVAAARCRLGPTAADCRGALA